MLLAFLLALFPSIMQCPLRRLLGARIANSARIRFGTLLLAQHIEVGPHANIGPFSFIRAGTFKAGAYSEIKPLTVLRASHVEIGPYAHVASTVVVSSELTNQSKFQLGDHSRLGPFCWIEPGEGVTIGKQTGIGGHTLIFTHAVWADYLRGGQVAYGPVVIGDDTWVSWRVSILANVNIGDNSMVALGAVVNKSVPPNSLAAGVPARVITGVMGRAITDTERLKRAQRILADFAEQQVPSDAGRRLNIEPNRLRFTSKIAIDDEDNLQSGDTLFLVNRSVLEPDREALIARGVSVLDYPRHEISVASSQPYIMIFVEFLRRYGVRLYVLNQPGSA